MSQYILFLKTALKYILVSYLSQQVTSFCYKISNSGFTIAMPANNAIKPIHTDAVPTIMHNNSIPLSQMPNKYCYWNAFVIAINLLT